MHSIFKISTWSLSNDLILTKTHVVNDLKINMFIKNDIIKSKSFIIEVETKIVYKNNCKIIIFIEIRLSKTSTIQKIIYLKKIIVIFALAKIVVFIHLLRNVLFQFKNFLFESNEINQLIMYVHIVDVFTKTIIIRNDNDMSIQIFRNFRLKKFLNWNILTSFTLLTKKTTFTIWL